MEAKKGRIASFFYGATLPVRAFRLLISTPRLMAWSALPVAISLAAYVYLIRGLHAWAEGGINDLFAWAGWDARGWFAASFLFLSQLLLLLAAAFSFSFIAGIIAAPFNDFLAESTEAHTEITLPAAPKRGLGGQIGVLLIDIGKTAAAGALTIVALLLSWIPVLNAMATVLAMYLICFQYVSYAQTRRGQGWRDGFSFLGRHKFACLGFGMVTSTLFAIPFAAPFFLPLAVIGGTLLAARGPGGNSTPTLR
mgnify:CR=1 FL=1